MKTRLYEDFKKAMKEKDQLTKNTIQLLRAEILKKEKDTQKELNDEDIIRLIKKERDNRFDLLNQLENTDRKDLINQTFEEMNILNRYLPNQLSDAELNNEILKILNEIQATSIKDLGKAMKACKEKLEMLSHPSVLANLVKTHLQEKESNK